MSSLLASFEATQAQRREIVLLLEPLDENGRAWKAKPDDWSPLQIAEHLLRSYETVGSREWASRQRESSGKAPRPHPFRLRLVVWAIARGVRLPLPSPDVEPRGDTPWPLLQERWQAASDAMQSAVQAPDAVLEANRPFAHPIIGALNAREMLALNHVHNAYHLRQLKAVLKALPQS